MLYLLKKKVIRKFGNNKNYRKVRDHCHYTGKYRGVEHSICNLRFDVPDEILLVLHNCSNYDIFLLLLQN